jgi:hypothetical protein
MHAPVAARARPHRPRQPPMTDAPRLGSGSAYRPRTSVKLPASAPPPEEGGRGLRVSVRGRARPARCSCAASITTGWSIWGRTPPTRSKPTSRRALRRAPTSWARGCSRPSAIAQVGDGSHAAGCASRSIATCGRPGLKRAGVSDRALRHTAATLAYRYSHELRAVQDLLGYRDPRTTARYARWPW